MRYLDSQMMWLRAMVLLVTFGVSACEEHNLSPDTGEYFPVEASEEWHYQRWHTNRQSGLPEYVFDTLKVQAGNEVVVDGKYYRKIIDAAGVWNKVVRVEGSKYYARNHELYRSDFSHEYVFLDTDKAVGESWYYIKTDAGYSKAEYIILEKGATANVLDVVYKDVIKVRVNYYQPVAGTDDHELWISSVHYYARGVGEIYSFYPYPASFTYSDLSSFMMNSKK